MPSKPTNELPAVAQERSRCSPFASACDPGGREALHSFNSSSKSRHRFGNLATSRNVNPHRFRYGSRVAIPFSEMPVDKGLRNKRCTLNRAPNQEISLLSIESCCISAASTAITTIVGIGRVSGANSSQFIDVRFTFSETSVFESLRKE